MKKNTKILILALTASGVIVTMLLLKSFHFDQAEHDISSLNAWPGKKPGNVVKKKMPHSQFAFTTVPPSDKPQELTATEVQQFVTAVDRTFGILMVAGVNEDEINKQLSKLNKRKEAGMRALVRILSAAPKNETEVRTRISVVDYLLYRARWDEATRSEILRIATSEIPGAIAPKLKGAMIVERAEIVGRTAALDWDATSQALHALKHASARRVAAAEAVFALAADGVSLDEARRRVKEVVPAYVIVSQRRSEVK